MPGGKPSLTVYRQIRRAADGQVSFGALCNRYIADALPLRHSTRKSYLTILNKHVMPKWENMTVSQVRSMYVQEWLNNMTLSATTKGKSKLSCIAFLKEQCSGS